MRDGRRALVVLAALVAAGVALRAALMLSYSPAFLDFNDTWGYVKAADGPLFMDDWIRPAGYPAFLAALHAIWGSLSFAIVVQHALGIATALLAYATVRRLGGPPWAALVPAAVVLLCLDVVYFEHALLSETLFALLTVAALYALARALDGAVAWAAVAGLLAALAATVRGAGLFALPVLVLVALLAPGRRLPRAGALAAVAAAVLAGYAALNASQTGTFGLADGSGWSTYSRAAPFADCRAFDPPRGTEDLCETSDVRDRGTAEDYAWGNSPATRLYGGPPHHSEEVGAFGRAAILGQPRAYLDAVATDLWSFVSPTPENRRMGPAGIELDSREFTGEPVNRTVVEPFYGPYTLEAGDGVEALAAVQRVVRVHGALVLLALLLSLAALPFAAPRRRVALVLLAGTAVVPVVVATATTAYTWRYAVPTLGLLMAAGALGADVLAGRLARRSAAAEEAPRRLGARHREDAIA